MPNVNKQILKSFKSSIKNELASIKAQEDKQAFKAAKKEGKVIIKEFKGMMKSGGLPLPMDYGQTPAGNLVPSLYTPDTANNTTGSMTDQATYGTYTPTGGLTEQSYEDGLSRGGPASTVDMSSLFQGLNFGEFDWAGAAETGYNMFNSSSAASDEIARLTSGGNQTTDSSKPAAPATNYTPLLVLAAIGIGLYFMSKKGGRR
jgi:hypothetical protein